MHPARVTALARDDAGFTATTAIGPIRARRAILCTGGKSLPKSGSDGGGYALAEALGHSITQPLLPALVPLVLPAEHWIRSLAGLTLPTRLSLRAGARRLHATRGSTLCTHVGLSGPAVLDMSRHWLMALHHDPAARLEIAWLPDMSVEDVDRLLVSAQGRGTVSSLREHLPERLVRTLCEVAGAPPAGDLPRDARRRLAALVAATPLPVVGDRGFTVAEATAGGVPLAEVRLDAMESRVCPGLHLAGEVLDVDGRIGGFNFQWAWASGFVAGRAAAGRFVAETDGNQAAPADARPASAVAPPAG
jgi:predicted Rossmann fold flavoprotein